MGGVYHKIRRLRNVVLGKIALLQRHPPGGKVYISLPLPRLQAVGLLFFCAGQEHPQRFAAGQQRVVAVAALQNHQRLRGQLPRGQVRTLAAGIGTVLHRLALVGWAQGFVPQAVKVHIGAGRFLPAADALCRRQVKIIGVQGDAGRELPGQRIRKGGLAAAAAAIQRQHQRLCGLLCQCGGKKGDQARRCNVLWHGCVLL